MRHGNLREPREGRAASGAAEGIVALRRVEVVRTYLALDERDQLRAASGMTPESVYLKLLSPCPVRLYRMLYREVGQPWYWHDRLDWSDEELARHLAAPDVAVWHVSRERAGEESMGFFELQRHGDNSVEIAYLGLVPEYIGRGYGGFLLTRAAQEAWAMGAARVWLHTCTLDAERALPNYKARGFREFKTERLEVDIDGTQVVAERLLHD